MAWPEALEMIYVYRIRGRSVNNVPLDLCNRGSLSYLDTTPCVIGRNNRAHVRPQQHQSLGETVQ
jgi:hypothetical protein